MFVGQGQTQERRCSFPCYYCATVQVTPASFMAVIPYGCVSCLIGRLLDQDNQRNWFTFWFTFLEIWFLFSFG